VRGLRHDAAPRRTNEHGEEHGDNDECFTAAGHDPPRFIGCRSPPARRPRHDNADYRFYTDGHELFRLYPAQPVSKPVLAALARRQRSFGTIPTSSARPAQKPPSSTGGCRARRGRPGRAGRRLAPQPSLCGAEAPPSITLRAIRRVQPPVEPAHQPHRRTIVDGHRLATTEGLPAKRNARVRPTMSSPAGTSAK